MVEKNYLANCKVGGPWLWRSWQSGRLRHQSSADCIPTSAFLNLIVSTACRQDENKQKRGRERPIKKVKKNCKVARVGLSN